MKIYHPLTVYLSNIRTFIVKCLLQRQIHVDVLLYRCLNCLLYTCLAKIICHFREYCNGIYNRTGVNCSGLLTIRSRFLIGYIELIIFLQLNILIALIFLLYILAPHMIL